MSIFYRLEAIKPSLTADSHQLLDNSPSRHGKLAYFNKHGSLDRFCAIAREIVQWIDCMYNYCCCRQWEVDELVNRYFWSRKDLLFNVGRKGKCMRSPML